MINVFRLGIGREENDSALLPQSRQHIASAKYTIDIMAEAPTIVFVVNSLGKSIMEELTTEERVYEICNIPVSYTHLDVYKRQGEGVSN